MNFNQQQNQYDHSQYSTSRKWVIAIIVGLFSMFLANYHVTIDLGDLQINFPWAMIFPILLAIAYGGKYGLISGFAGGAYYPMLLWTHEGYANLTTIILILSLFYFSGYVLRGQKPVIRFPLIKKIISLALIGAIGYSICYLLLYNTFLGMNPPFWGGETIDSLSTDFLISLTIKDSINFPFMVVAAELLFKLPFIRNLLGFRSPPFMKTNKTIFSFSIAVALIMWLIFVGMDYFLVKDIQERDANHYTIALFVMLFTGIIVARILIRFIEHRHKVEYELQVSEEGYRMIGENANDLIAIHGFDEIISYVSPSVTRFTGYTPEDIIGKKVSLFLHPDETEYFRNNLKELLSSQSKDNTIHRIRHKDGSYTWVETNGKLIDHKAKNTKNIQIVSRDITDRLKAENTLKESEQTLTRIVNHAPFTMILVDRDMRIMKVNTNPLTSEDETSDAIGNTIGESFRCIEPARNGLPCGSGKWCESCIIRKLFVDTYHKNIDHQKMEGEIIIQKASGMQKHTVLVSSSAIYRASEKYVLITIDDITDRKKMELQLEKAKDKAEESDRLKSAFLANISHEIRTPMNGIIGFANMLKLRKHLVHKTDRYLDIIMENSKRLMYLVNDILDISKIESGHINFTYKEVNINDLLDDIHEFIAPSAKEKALKLTVHKYREFNTPIKTDDGRLRQVFINLLSNALKFTEKGEISFGYQTYDEVIAFYVKDSGIGIPKSEQENIFRQFRQVEHDFTKVKGGTGLGLSISKKIVELWGGKISVESSPGEGSTFWFTRPLKTGNGG